MVAAAGGSGSGSEIDMNSSLIIEGVRKTVLQESFKMEKVKSLMGNQLQKR